MTGIPSNRPAGTGHDASAAGGPGRDISAKQRKRSLRRTLFRGGLLFLAAFCALIWFFRVPILTSVGNYLVVSRPLQKADLIVCLMGVPVPRGLEVADLYKDGVAPFIFVGREEPPEGAEVLKARGAHYPEPRELLITMLCELGIPESAILTTDKIMSSTISEARVIREVALERGFRSLLIVTSPSHTRRAWRTFRKVFGKDRITLGIVPTPYALFRPDDWWKKRTCAKEVVIEYQKLLFYILRYSL